MSVLLQSITVMPAVVYIIQAITETIPISSSAHVIFISNLISYDINLDLLTLLHIPTALACLIYLGKLPFSMMYDFFFSRKFFSASRMLFFSLLISVGVGFIVNMFISEHISDFFIIGVLSILSGLMLLWADLGAEERSLKDFGIGDAVGLGLFSFFGFMSGFSRLASNLIILRARGFDLKDSWSISLLMSIPMSIGSAVLLISRNSMQELSRLTAEVNYSLFYTMILLSLICYKLLANMRFKSYAIYKITFGFSLICYYFMIF